MTVAEKIHATLASAFAPSELVVEDDSHKHAGHSGSRPTGETHFSVRLVSESFAGLGRVERQRRVYAALAELMKPDGIHALALTTLTPAEVWQEH